MLFSTSFVWAAEVWSLGCWLGLVNLVLFHQHPLCTYRPGCHPCPDPRSAFRRFFFRPWLHVNAEGTDGFWIFHWADAECSTSETSHCLPLCFGPSLYRRFPVEAAAFLPYSCSCARRERKQHWRSKADSYWKLFLYSPYNREDNSLRTALQSLSKRPAGAE